MPEHPKSKSTDAGSEGECQCGRWVLNPDGSYTVTVPNVATLHCPCDDDINVRTPVIRAVTIADLSKVVEHSITRVYDTVSHTVHFEGGGVASFLHGTDGSGYEFNCRNVVFEVGESGQILVLGTFEER